MSYCFDLRTDRNSYRVDLPSIVAKVNKIVARGIDRLIRLGSISFPASVALLILLFILLITCQLFLGDKWTREIVRVLDVPVSESSRAVTLVTE